MGETRHLVGTAVWSGSGELYVIGTHITDGWADYDPFEVTLDSRATGNNYILHIDGENTKRVDGWTLYEATESIKRWIQNEKLDDADTLKITFPRVAPSTEKHVFASAERNGNGDVVLMSCELATGFLGESLADAVVQLTKRDLTYHIHLVNNKGYDGELKQHAIDQITEWLATQE